jgi:AcrR family transcriptional regulator
MATRESVLAATAQLYAEHGWRGTTTKRIAEAAGINEVTVFRQFGSKAALLDAAIRHASTPSPVIHLPDIPARLAEELTVWALAHHQSIAAKSGIIRSCLAESDERPALASRACEGGMVAFGEGTRYLRAARSRGLIGRGASIEAATLMLINSIFMDAITRDLMPPGHARPVEALVAQFVELLLRGLGAPERE